MARRNSEKDIPHIDDCGSFEIFAAKIKTYLDANNVWNWFVLQERVEIPTEIDSNGGPPRIKKPNQWSDAEKQLIWANQKVKNILQKSVNDSLAHDIGKVDHAKDAWELIQAKFTKHSGVRTQNCYNLMRQLDNFKFLPGEKVSEAQPRFEALIKALEDHDKTFKDSELCLKIFSSLPPEYEKVALPIREGAEWNTMTVNQYFGKLEAYELEGRINPKPSPASFTNPYNPIALTANENNLKVYSQQEIDTLITNAIQKLNIPAQPAISNTPENLPSLVADYVKRAMHHQNKRFDAKLKKYHAGYQRNYNNPSTSQSEQQETQKRKEGCYNCGKIDHFIAKCPEPRKEK